MSVGTWRFCLIGLQASWQVCICICASVCVSVCPIYGGNLLALWTSPTCAAVEMLIQATNNSNFQVGNQQRRNCALYMVYLPVQSVTRSSWLNCALRGHEADNWCDWVSIGHLCLYILNKVEIWTGVTDAWLTDWLIHSQTLKDRATQLLIKYKSGALVTQWPKKWALFHALLTRWENLLMFVVEYF